VSSILCYNHSLGCLTLPLHLLPAPSSAGCTQQGAASAAGAASPRSKGRSTVAIAEIPAHNRRLPALSQAGVLAALQLLLAAATDPAAALQLADPAIAGGSSAAARPLPAAQLMMAEDLLAATGESRQCLGPGETARRPALPRQPRPGSSGSAPCLVPGPHTAGARLADARSGCRARAQAASRRESWRRS
jgi:hypothetical protein